MTHTSPAARCIRRYGYIPDLPDARDLRYEAPPRLAGRLPASADLRKTGCMPPVYDQGQLGSCTANALAGAVEFDLVAQGLAAATPSRLFVYYNERVIEGTVREDAGAMLRDGIKTLARQGACREDDWPYDVARFARKPPKAAYKAGSACLIEDYYRLDTIDDMRACLANDRPFVFGFSVYESFESDEVARTGVVPMPRRREAQLGGHAVLAVGYDDDNDRLIVRNSWGSGWGQDGYFTMPYAYVEDRNLSDDFWTVKAVSGPIKAPRA